MEVQPVSGQGGPVPIPPAKPANSSVTETGAGEIRETAVDQVDVSDRSRQFSASFKEPEVKLRLSAAELRSLLGEGKPKEPPARSTD